MSPLSFSPTGAPTTESSLRQVREAVSAVVPEKADVIARAGFRGILPIVLDGLREKSDDMLSAIQKLAGTSTQFSRTSLGAYFSEQTLRPAFEWIARHPNSRGIGTPDASGENLVEADLQALTDDGVQKGASYVLQHHVRAYSRELYRAGPGNFEHSASETLYRMTYATKSKDNEIYLCLGAETAIEQTFRMYRGVLTRLFCRHPSSDPASARIRAARRSVGVVLQQLSSIPAERFDKFSGRPSPDAQADIFDLRGGRVVLTKDIPQSDIGCAGSFARIGGRNAIQAVNDWVCDVVATRAEAR